MEKIEENDYEEESKNENFPQEKFDEPDPNEEESKQIDTPLRPTFLRDSAAQEQGDMRYTCIEGSNFDVGFDQENNNNFQADVEDEKDVDITGEFDILFNGNAGVGKTSIIQRFVFNKFSQNVRASLSEGKCSKILKINQQTTIKMKITDTMGSELPGQIPKQLYRDVHGVVIVFDITEQETFSAVENWVKVAREQSPRDAVLFIVGNKTDLAGLRKVSTADGHMIAKQNNVTYYEVSAKNGNNIALVFEDLANKMIEKQEQNTGAEKVERADDRKSIRVQPEQGNGTGNNKVKKKKGKCCK